MKQKQKNHVCLKSNDVTRNCPKLIETLNIQDLSNVSTTLAYFISDEKCLLSILNNETY